MGLPKGQQYGFLAQELGELFPNMVADIVQPAELDSMGAEIHPEVAFKAVSLQGLLPLTIEALKRQEARIAQLEEMVAACCEAHTADGRAVNDASSASTGELETDLRIIPNPVIDQTELRYTLAEPGRVRLEITDQTGRVVLTKEEGQREASAYVYQWDTTSLSPGTYNCALFVNDEQVVRKAVKLNAR